MQFDSFAAQMVPCHQKKSCIAPPAPAYRFLPSSTLVSDLSLLRLHNEPVQIRWHRREARAAVRVHTGRRRTVFAGCGSALHQLSSVKAHPSVRHGPASAGVGTAKGQKQIIWKRERMDNGSVS